jgi:hypothetical protein
MNDSKGSHQGYGSDHSSFHESHRPYWKRAHRDWRVWVGVFLMLVAMAIFVMSDYFTLWPRRQPPQPLSGAVGK